MKYKEFEKIMSPPRMGRYVAAVGGDTRKAMTLYRQNLKLSQELFTIISCFEIALRNSIDFHYVGRLGNDWLLNSVNPGGIFTHRNCRKTKQIVQNGLRKLGTHVTHPKLVAEMDFGFWRYLFARPQFRAGGNSLLQIFPNKPRSTPTLQYNQTYVFNELTELNLLRNRIAHHEPICFTPSTPVKHTHFTRQHHQRVRMLFQWMGIDEASLLYGLDHIQAICNRIDAL